MSVNAEAAAAAPVRGGRVYLVLLALVIGLLAGIFAASLGDGVREPLIQTTTVVGNLWLNALKMTVIPLIVALLVTGIAQTAKASRGGRIAGRSLAVFAIIYIASAILGTLLAPFLMDLFPLPASAVDALRTGLAAIDATTASAPIPGFADFMGGIVPANAFAAAAEGQILPLVVFTVLFALAATQIGDQRRQSLVGFFEGVADALLVLIGWVLWIAPLGVFALGFTLGASAGAAVFAGLLYYIVLVSGIGLAVTLAAYLVAVLAGGLNFFEFAKAMFAPQSVAISTRSSLASLPAMLASASILKIRDQVTDVTLPMAVALFRATGPAINVAVALYVAHWLGHEPSLAQLIAATALAAIISWGSVSLPGEISFIANIAPIGIALGVPIEPLAILVAVEMIPDIVRTLGNVTMDVAVTAAVNEQTARKTVEK